MTAKELAFLSVAVSAQKKHVTNFVSWCKLFRCQIGFYSSTIEPNEIAVIVKFDEKIMVKPRKDCKNQLLSTNL